MFTYSIAFRAGTPFIGGFDRAGLQGILSDITTGIGNPNPLAPTIPETVYSMFQLTFAIITAALIAGSFAERMKFSAMLWFIGAVGDLRLFADRALGVGTGRLPQLRQSAMPGSRCSTSPAARWCMSIPAPPA